LRQSVVNNRLLDKEAFTTILDLLQECKAHNSRLAEYFGRVGVPQSISYIPGEIEIKDKDRFHRSQNLLAPMAPTVQSRHYCSASEGQVVSQLNYVDKSVWQRG